MAVTVLASWPIPKALCLVFEISRANLLGKNANSKFHVNLKKIGFVIQIGTAVLNYQLNFPTLFESKVI